MGCIDKLTLEIFPMHQLEQLAISTLCHSKLNYLWKIGLTTLAKKYTIDGQIKISTPPQNAIDIQS